MPIFRHEELPLYYEDQGTGPPLILLHAFPLSSAAFAPQRVLAGRCRLILPDLRGFGRSPPGGNVTGMATFARDVLALMDHLKLSTAAVGGVSLGGYITMALLREDPSRVRALVLVDTQATADDEAGKRRREEMACAVLDRGVEHLVEVQVPKLLAQPPDPAVERQVQGWVRQATPRGAAAAVRGMALRPDSRELLRRFGGPALVVVGQRDEVTPRAKAQEMAELLERSHLVEIPGAGHLSHLESPEPVNRAIEEFLRQLPA